METKASSYKTFQEPSKENEKEEERAQKTFFPFSELKFQFQESKTKLQKTFLLLKWATTFPVWLSVPRCGEESWNKFQSCISFFFSPVFVIISLKSLDLKMGELPLWSFALILGLVLMIVMFFTTKNEAPPKWAVGISFYSFFMSLIWIFFLTSTIIDLLLAIGEILNISDEMIGATILAWVSLLCLVFNFVCH